MAQLRSVDSPAVGFRVHFFPDDAWAFAFGFRFVRGQGRSEGEKMADSSACSASSELHIGLLGRFGRFLSQ
jgi:hypothetical protein